MFQRVLGVKCYALRGSAAEHLWFVYNNNNDYVAVSGYICVFAALAHCTQSHKKIITGGGRATGVTKTRDSRLACTVNGSCTHAHSRTRTIGAMSTEKGMSFGGWAVGPVPSSFVTPAAGARQPQIPTMAANSETEAASRARMSRRVAAYLEQTAQAVPPSISGSASFAFNEPRRMPIFDDRAGSRWSERATEQHSRLFRDDMAAPIDEVQYGRAAIHQYALDASPRPAEPVRSSEDTNSSGSAKRSRYLREADRRSIIRRIAGGEKQAALAREFGVTRAAICHINKNRVEILARSIHADVRHPKRALYQTISKPLYVLICLRSHGTRTGIGIHGA